MVLNLLAASEEITVVYAGGCLPRAGRMKKTLLGARKVETAVLRCPVQKNRIKTVKKESFNSCGEASTFQGTYSGVAYRPLSELPLIDHEEKVKIFAAAPAVLSTSVIPVPPEAWKDRHGNDVPLFWQEGKPIGFYNAFLEELQVKAVFDVSAGTGALMEACLTHGVQYHGLCLNREHLQWLQVVADRAACAIISLEGSTLYCSELATQVKKHFPDVLQSLVEGKEGDEAMEPESGDDAA